MTRPHRVAARTTAGVAAGIVVACAPSAEAELVDRLRAAPPLDGYELTVVVAEPSPFDCFAPDGTMTAVVSGERIGVFDSADVEAVLVVDGALSLRPSAFSAGSSGWWTVAEHTSDASVARVVGPVIDTLVLRADPPGDMLRELARSAATATRGDDGTFRLTDANEPRTVTDVTLDAHGHVAEVAVAAEDPNRPGRPDRTQPRYRVRYTDSPSLKFSGVSDDATTVDERDLDRLDTRPGACGATVGG